MFNSEYNDVPICVTDGSDVIGKFPKSLLSNLTDHASFIPLATSLKNWGNLNQLTNISDSSTLERITTLGLHHLTPSDKNSARCGLIWSAYSKLTDIELISLNQYVGEFVDLEKQKTVMDAIPRKRSPMLPTTL